MNPKSPSPYEAKEPVSLKLDRLISSLGKTGLKTATAELKTIKDEVVDLESMATFDGLTGAYNRSSLLGEIRKSSALLKRLGGLTFGLAVVDMDDFKTINDRHGHLGGDLVLKTTVERLKSELRSGDKVFRVGGDEFLVYFDAVEQDSTISDRRLDEIIGSINQTVGYESYLVSVGASFGYSQAAFNELTGVAYANDQRAETIIEAIYKRADEAMYQHKTGLIVPKEADEPN